jgi:hypothetical protein
VVVFFRCKGKKTIFSTEDDFSTSWTSLSPPLLFPATSTHNNSPPPTPKPAFAYRLVSGKDIILAGQAALALFALGKVAAWFTSLGLVFVAAVLAFSVPKIYELRKGEIDGLAAKAADQGKAHYKKFVEPYVAKIPRASTAVGGGGGSAAAAASAAPAKKAE